MKLKGDLDSIGLAELFKTLADQKASGILSVTSAMGEKHISIQAGTLSVVSDRLAERTRLGDLLVARGHLTEAQLIETLKDQRQNDPHTRLGDLLIKRGILNEDKILDALRFQLEEEIYDLFTWKGANFEFDSDKGVDDVAARSPQNDDLHHLSVDAQALIAEASRRMAEWKEIQQRLPTPYLCFKISPKGDELLSRATRSTALILKLIKEGRTLETTVKRSCMGRFSVCKAAIKLLDDGWILPYPTSELRMLASEHRAQKRFADALNIYRRLLEATEAEAERQQLQQLIDDTIDSILRAREAGTDFEGAEIFSHKKAAEDYMRRQRNRRIALYGFAALSAIAALVLLMMRYAPKAEMPQNYLNAIKASDTAVAEGRYEDAMEVWRIFYDSLPDKESDTARRVMERRKMLPKQFDSYVESLLQPFEMLERNGGLDAAKEGYAELLAQYPSSPLSTRMSDGLARIEKKKHEQQLQRIQAERENKLEEARKLMREKLYTQARKLFSELQEATPEGSGFRTEAVAQLKTLDAIEERAARFLAAGMAEVKQKHAEKAIDILARAFGEWHDLPDAQKARAEYNRLKTRLGEVEQLRKQARLREKDDVLSALAAYQKLQSEYAEYEAVATLGREIGMLEQQAAAIDRQIADAQALYKSGQAQAARDRYSLLVQHHSAFLALRRIKVPVTINSRPQSVVKLDGREIGRTPQAIELPVGGSLSITCELPGYETFERRIVNRLNYSDLEIFARLQPKPVRELAVAPGVFAPPRGIGDVLYISSGTTLTALQGGGEKLWTCNNLLDDRRATHASATGAGPEVPVPEKSWWYSRNMPEPAGKGALLLALRSREIVEIGTAKQSRTVLLTLPVEPVGQPCLVRNSSLAMKTLLALAGTDGKIRVYDVARPDSPLWELPADPANAAPKGAIIAGLCPRGGGAVVALAGNGRLAAFSLAEGKELWSMELGGTIASSTMLPLGASDSLAAIILATGTVTAVDLNLHEKLWELPILQAMDEALFAACDESGVYIANRAGVLKKFSRQRARAPVALWKNSRALDGPPATPPVFGEKGVYIATTEGTVYALDAASGNELWTLRTKEKPKFIGVLGKFLYLVTEDGHVAVYNAE